jgi:hypothetical protein
LELEGTEKVDGFESEKDPDPVVHGSLAHVPAEQKIDF